MESRTSTRLNSGRSSAESPIPDQSTYQDRPDLKDLASELLEFPKILTMLADHTRFFLSREMADAVQPQISIEDVEILQAETYEARNLLDIAGDIGLTGTTDLRPLVKRATLDGILTGKELVTIGYTIRSISGAQTVASSAQQRLPRLTAIADEIPDLSGLPNRIFAAISESGDVLDIATPRLRTLRRRVATTYRRLVAMLEQIASSQSTRPALQSTAIATRGDRLVLEVKIEQRVHVPGIVHDVSQTGATLFVEPFKAVDPCNEWRETAAEAAREEEKVRRNLSRLVKRERDVILAAMETAAKIDLIVARARLARSMGASSIKALPADSPVRARLVSARHPLLTLDAVPITLSVGPKFSGLIITGPNTGGKTVALKTLGLFALMHQSGLQVPAAPESELAVFDAIFADIGDAQSIEQSVSTFSSHFGNVVHILDQATSDSLVLLDELGTGTDPEEGSALARAILKHLASKKTTVAVTTHQRVVAEFVESVDSLQNASVELDPETMLPTYEVTMGIPGRSYAFSVAERLGLDKNLLVAASEFLDSSHKQAEKLLSTIQSERDRIRTASANAEQERRQAEVARKEFQGQLASVKREQEDLIERTRRELRNEVEKIRRSIRRVVDDARENRDVATARRAINRLRQELAAPTWFPIAGPEPPAVEEGEEAPPIMPGDSVEVKGLNVRASVITVSGQGIAELAMGNSRIELDVQQLRRVEINVSDQEKDPVQVSTPNIDSEVEPLDLRGVRTHEVREKILTFLDRCALAQLDSCYIVHGVGSGAVREAVWEALSEIAEVVEFGPPDESNRSKGVTRVGLA